MLEGSVIVKFTDVSEPEVGTLPVPLHPVATYCIPVPPETGEVTDSVIEVPESNQPDGGDGVSYKDETVR
jgi:hypothetical protein